MKLMLGKSIFGSPLLLKYIHSSNPTSKLILLLQEKLVALKVCEVL
jgi:hypothetical protein